MLLKYGGTRKFHMSQSVPQMQKKGKTIRPEVVNLRVIAVLVSFLVTVQQSNGITGIITTHLYNLRFYLMLRI